MLMTGRPVCEQRERSHQKVGGASCRKGKGLDRTVAA